MRSFLFRSLPVSLIAGILSAGICLTAWAQEPAAGPVEQTPKVEGQFRNIKVDGDGDVTSSSQDLTIRVQARDLFQSPFFVSGRGMVGQRQLRDYDLHRWGGELGAGWALDPKTDLLATYRLESFSTHNVSPDADPAFRDVQGLSRVGAFGLAVMRDTRDDPLYPTAGRRMRLGSELAVKGWGGDYSFGRLQGDYAGYWTPWKERGEGVWWEEITFVERFRIGWMEAFGSTDEVPFFERYFVGSGSSVRGHRGDWLSPRRIDDQFIGGETEFINNVEARLPIFKERFKRKLFTAAFFDVGRSWRRFSEAGDFGYGAGAGLRYVVHLGPVHGVLRFDYGFNLAHEDDDTTGRLHIVFGSAF